MARTIIVEYDGRALVPVEPLDLAVGERFEVEVPGEGVVAGADASGEDWGTPPPEVNESLGAFAKWIDSLPSPDRSDLPTDGAKNYRHYRYGHPKVD